MPQQTINARPEDVQPISAREDQVQPVPQKGLIRRGYEAATRPLLDYYDPELYKKAQQLRELALSTIPDVPGKSIMGMGANLLTDFSPLDVAAYFPVERLLGVLKTLRGGQKVVEAGREARTFTVAPKAAETAGEINSQARLQDAIREGLQESRVPPSPREVSLPRTDNVPVATAQARETVARAVQQGRLSPEAAARLQEQAAARQAAERFSPTTTSGVPERVPLSPQAGPGNVLTVSAAPEAVQPLERAAAASNSRGSVEALADGLTANPHLPKLRISAGDFRVLEAERARRASAIGGDIPDQLHQALDLAFLRYRKVQDLYKAAKAAGEDPAHVQTLFQGARELGSRYSKAIRDARRWIEAGRPSGTGAGSFSDVLSNVARTGEAGRTSGEAALRLGLGTAGAIGGGSIGDTPEERMRNAAIGATGGLLTPEAIKVFSAAGKAVGRNAENLYYFNMLSRPTTGLKANAGGLSGALSAASELAASGDMARARMILGQLRPDIVAKRYLAALKTPEIVGGNLQKAGNLRGITGIPTRHIAAFDYAMTKAIEAGGISAEDAARLTLSGTPTSKPGQHLLQFLNEMPWLRRLFSPFPKVGVQFFERGAERLPLPGTLRKATTPISKARVALGTTAAAGAYAVGDKVPPEYLPITTAAAGPYGLPALLGTTARKAVESGSLPLSAVIQSLEQQSPLPVAISPGNAVANLIPGIVGDIARARDTHERETRPNPKAPLLERQIESVINQAKARIPGVRETLPIRPTPVDTFGKPVVDRSSKVKRLLTGQPRNLLKREAESPVVDEFKRLGVDLNPPSYQREGKVQGHTFPLTPGASEKMQQTRRSQWEPILQRVINNPKYQALPDDSKRMVLRKVVGILSSYTGRAANVKAIQESRRDNSSSNERQ